MVAKKIGTKVMITKGQGGGMSEFLGQRGTIINIERDGNQRMYRVRLDEPVTIAGIGEVSDDLWSGGFLRCIPSF